MEWRYAATHLRTGRVLADTVPLHVDSFQRTRGDSALLMGKLDLTGDPTYVQDVLTPRRTVVWAIGDGQPMWGGILWDEPHRSALDTALPLQAATLESLFNMRRINDTLSYTATDQIDIFRALVNYALAKPGGNVANFAMDTTTKSGVLLGRLYPASDHANVLGAMQDLANPVTGFEWTIDPVWVGGQGNALGWKLRFGYPTLGNNSTTNLVMTFPGNVKDYQWPRVGSQSVNSIRAIGDTVVGGSAQMISDPTRGQNTTELAAGFPLLEDTKSHAGQGIQDVATLNTLADADLATATGDTITPVLVMQPGLEPQLGTYNIGDTVMFAATSNIHPSGVRASSRISSIQVYPTSDASTPEKVWVTLHAIQTF